jgi:hypothetical protein
MLWDSVYMTLNGYIVVSLAVASVLHFILSAFGTYATNKQ